MTSCCLCLFLTLYLCGADMSQQTDEEHVIDREDCGSMCSARDERNKLAYCVTDTPPWYLCILLAIQVGISSCVAAVALKGEASPTLNPVSLYCEKVACLFRDLLECLV